MGQGGQRPGQEVAGQEVLADGEESYGPVASLLPTVTLFLTSPEAFSLGPSPPDQPGVFRLLKVLATRPRVSLASGGRELHLHTQKVLGQEEEEGHVLGCRHCSYSTSYFHLMLPHLALHSSSELQPVTSSQRLECAKCGKVFKKSEVLEAHMKKEHLGNATPWECNLCGKGFTRKASLEEHMDRHQGKKQRHCAPCNKYFYDTVGAITLQGLDDLLPGILETPDLGSPRKPEIKVSL